MAEVANKDTVFAEPRSEALIKGLDAFDDAAGWGRNGGDEAQRPRALGPHHDNLSPSRS